MQQQQVYPQQQMQMQGQPMQMQGQPMQMQGQPMQMQQGYAQPGQGQVQSTAPKDTDKRGNFFDLKNKPNYKTGDVPSGKVIYCLGCCIGLYGFYCECPEMIGCSHSLTFLCCTWEQMTCKPVRKEEETTACCVTNRTNCDLRPSLAIIKYRTAAGCWDIRCAIPSGPWDYEYPSMLNLFGLNLCINGKCAIGCCKNTDELRTLAGIPI